MQTLPSSLLRTVQIDLFNFLTLVDIVFFFDLEKTKIRIFVESIVNSHQFSPPSIVVNILIFITLIFLEIQIDLSIQANSQRFLPGSRVFRVIETDPQRFIAVSHIECCSFLFETLVILLIIFSYFLTSYVLCYHVFFVVDFFLKARVNQN